MGPMLIKGQGLQYVPWGSLQNLISSLPDIQEGAGHWIRKLEEEMMGKMMALGDVKALLGKILGTEKMLEVMRKAGLSRRDMGGIQVDGVEFDRYRGRVWAALRDMYPTRPDAMVLKGVPMGDSESPAAFVESQLRKWRMLTEKEIEGDPILTTLFRTAILEGLPAPAKSRMEEVVGLSSKAHREFVDHIVHAVERHRKKEKKQDNQVWGWPCRVYYNRDPQHRTGDKVPWGGGLGNNQGTEGRGINGKDKISSVLSRDPLRVP
ncbi:hypothetical protein SKAU_G00209650 [Synaphobranchus kaupii]|uniref:Gag protein n=1 Tax=Synaphobranchus kaupii TaxID=118154 RepID=A0A9Q1F932_SYNKA|nr:hypothetical protein SKAU_G00209650 [Synaphobranchus kaupii]